MDRVVEQRRVYPRPPIVEALVEFRFADVIPVSKMRGALAGSLPTGYDKSPITRHRVDVQAAITGRTVRTQAKSAVESYFFSGQGGLSLIGCRKSSLSAHVLAPYPGWENFKDVVEDCVATASRALGASALSSVAVRYIDRIVLPGAAPSITDFLSIAPRSPVGAGAILTGFLWTTETRQPETDDTLRIELRSAPPVSPDRQAVVLDLLAGHAFNAVVRLEDRALWTAVVDRLHRTQRNAFEDAITPETRKLFE